MNRANIVSALTTVLALTLVGVVYATPYSGLVTGSVREQAEDPVAQECPSPDDDGSEPADDGSNTGDSDACDEDDSGVCDSDGSAGDDGDPAEGSEDDDPLEECDPDAGDRPDDGPDEGDADDDPSGDGETENHGQAVRVAAHCAVAGRLHGEIVRSIARDKDATIADAEAACAEAMAAGAGVQAGSGGRENAAKAGNVVKPATVHRATAKPLSVKGQKPGALKERRAGGGASMVPRNGSHGGGMGKAHGQNQ